MNNSGSLKLFLTLEYGETVNYNQLSADNPLNMVQAELKSVVSHSAIALPDSIVDKPKTKMKAQQEFEERLKSVVPRYLTTLNEFMAQLDVLLEKIINEKASKIDLQSIGDIAHKIAGVAPTLGFERLGELGELVERDAISIMNSNDPMSLLGHFEKSVGKLLDAIEDTMVENISLPKISDAPVVSVSQI